MNKIYYVITTPYGNTYELSKEGYVLKYSNGLDLMSASLAELKNWQIVGLRELLPFSNLGRLIPLSDAAKIKNFAFKNGRPKYTLQDLDHGTTRIVGNVKYHGVRNLFIDKG